MPTVARIELRLRELTQLFNSMDPSPFRDKDLDDDAEDFIVGWARELPRDNPLDIVIHLDQPLRDGLSCEQCQCDIEESLRHFFAARTEHTRREFSELMRIGRVSLLLGLAFLAACFVASNLIGTGSHEDARGAVRSVIREGLIIVGWVALWRPLEIFLYDWWPIRRRMRLYQRLAASKVTVSVGSAPPPQPVSPSRPATA